MLGANSRVGGSLSYEKLVTVDVPEDGLPMKSLSSQSAAESIRSGSKVTLKYASLITLTVQNAALNLTMRMARTQKTLFITSTAVIMSEVFKLLTCIIMVRVDEGSSRRLVTSLKSNILDKPMDTFKVAIPSIIYYVQNNLIYLGATHLDAATAQVTYQLKILTTAIFSVVMLRKRLQPHQWVALLVLFVGVALVQLGELNKTKPTKSDAPIIQSPFIGFTAILGACFLSGFAGVYFEKILKGSSEVSLWIRNIQLSAIAIPFGLIQVFVSDSHLINDKGFFYGYSLLTWVVVLLQAQGGLLVAVVVKYADNILKGFATSLAIILSCVVSIYIFEFKLTFQFVVGAGLVIASIFLYSKPIEPGLPETVKSNSKL